MVLMLVFVNIMSLLLGRCKCLVCMVICCSDFLFVIYSVGVVFVIWYIIWSNSVFLFVFGEFFINMVVLGIILFFNIWFNFLNLVLNCGSDLRLIVFKVLILVVVCLVYFDKVGFDDVFVLFIINLLMVFYFLYLEYWFC